MKLKMRFLSGLSILLLCMSSAFAQAKPYLKETGSFEISTPSERIRWDKYLEGRNQLLLVGESTADLIDLTTRSIIDKRPITFPSLPTRAGANLDWQISPDGRRMLIVGHPDTKVGEKQVAWVWDLESGKRLAVLDQMPNRIRAGYWSSNGKTLVTFDSEWDPIFTRKLGVTFWDGETFEYRTTIFTENVTWLHLSDDGERFFAASGQGRSLLGVKFVSDKNGVINCWFTASGQLEKTISVTDANFSPKTREISVSPDDKFLLFVKKHKSNAAENTLLAWELNGSIQPRYELKPSPKIDDSQIKFSPDGKFFALDVGKNLQIYETATGHMRSELRDVELPEGWLNNDVIYGVEFTSKNFFKMGKMLTAFDAESGEELFKHRLEFDEVDVHDYTGAISGSETVDDTTILLNPARDLFVTQSEDFVRLIDSRTGELLQNVVAPYIVYDKNKKPKTRKGIGVLKAKWSNDGKTLCVFSADKLSVSLWKLVDG